MSSPPQAPKFQVTKLEAARRQLRVAISLWFQNGDEVAVHTLACAAHQIIHDINQKRGGKNLIFDSHIFKDEYRKEAVDSLKKDMNFFKHADKDPEGITEFTPLLTELFIMGSLWGIENFGLKHDAVEGAFSHWYSIQHPEFLTEKGLRQNAQLAQFKAFADLKTLSGHQFFKLYMQAASQLDYIK